MTTSTSTAAIAAAQAEPKYPDYHVAVPGDDQGAGIFGIGLSDEEAIRDAYDQSNTHEPTVTQDEDGQWVVKTSYGEDHTFAPSDETEARSYAAQKGFIARPCTQRLYEHVRDHGAPVGSFGWHQAAGEYDDLIDDAA